MKGRRVLTVILCTAAAVFALGGCLANSAAVSDSAVKVTDVTDAGSTQSFMASDVIVYGEVSAVGRETLTIRLGMLETEEVSFELTGGEVAIRTKAGTVIERFRMESAADPGEAADDRDTKDSFAMEDLEEGDIVSIALDEEGYAETITLMNFPAVSASGDGDNG